MASSTTPPPKAAHSAEFRDQSIAGPVSPEPARGTNPQSIPSVEEVETQASPTHAQEAIRSDVRANVRVDDRADDRAATPGDVLAALAYGLELVRHGAMLVESEGQLQLANRAAMVILQKQDGISLTRTGLVAHRASDTSLLRRLLRDAITAPQMGEPKESPMTLPRNIARNALVVRVVPGPEIEKWPEIGRRTALLKLYDLDMGLVVDERSLSSLYGLTRGEAALAARLVQGRSIEEAAGELFISPHTARTHLKRIFMKTDTHRQTELVVRILLTVL